MKLTKILEKNYILNKIFSFWNIFINIICNFYIQFGFRTQRYRNRIRNLYKNSYQITYFVNIFYWIYAIILSHLFFTYKWIKFVNKNVNLYYY